MASQDSEGFAPINFLFVELSIKPFAGSRDLENDLLKAVKGYFEDTNQSRGGKLLSNGLIHITSKDESTEFIIHYANKKNAERVLKKEDHKLPFDGDTYPLRVSRCSANLQEMYFPSDGAPRTSNAGSSTSSLSSNMSESCYVAGSSSKNDFQAQQDPDTDTLSEKINVRRSPEDDTSFINTYVIVTDNENGHGVREYVNNSERFKNSEPIASVHDSTKVSDADNQARQEDEDRAKHCQDDEDQATLNADNAPASGTIDKRESASDSAADFLSRTIKVENVTKDDENDLLMKLETKKWGGGSIQHYNKSPVTNNAMVVTFRKPETVEKFVEDGFIRVNNKQLAIVKPQPSEVEYPDSSSDGSTDESKTKGPISPVSDSGDETKPENIPLPDEGTDNSESDVANCPVKHQQEETTSSEPKEELTNDETKSGAASTLDENADENSALKDVERKSIETPVLSDESPYSPVGKRDGERDASSLDNRDRDESSDGKIRSTEIVDDKDNKVKSFKESDTTTTESEAVEDKKTKCFDKTNEDRENEEVDQEIKDHEFEKIGLTDERLGETDRAVRSPDSYVVTSTSNEKGVKNVVENESFEEVTPQDFTPEKNDGNILGKSRYSINDGSGDNKLNEPLDDLTNELEKLNLNTEESSAGTSGTVMVSEISEELKDTVEMFLESKRKGGGDILKFDFDPKKRRALVTFQDENVAKSLLARREITVQGNLFHITEPRPPTPEPLQDFDESELLSRTVTVQGVNDEMCEVISLFLENKKKGGGPVEWQNFSKDSESLTVRFQEREVAEALIKRGSLKIQGKEFILSNPTFPSMSLKPVVEVDDGESLEEKEKRSRTVVVKNVTEEMEEIITVFLENPKKGGGEIESNEFDEKNETLTLRFVEKEIAKKILSMGAIVIQKKTYEICPLLPVAREQEVVPEEPEEEREQRERTVQVQQVTPELMKSVLFLLASPMLSGGAVEKHDYDEEKKSLTVMFQRREVADSLAQHQKLHIHHQEFPIAKKEKNLLKYPQVSKEDSDSNLLNSAAAAVAAAPSSTCSDSVFEEGNSEESFKKNEDNQQLPPLIKIQVTNLPEEVSASILTKIFENKKYVGKDGVRVLSVELFRNSAVVKLDNPKVSQELIFKEVIDYKGFKIYIRRYEPESENFPGGIPENSPSGPLNEASNFPSRDSEAPDENSPWNDSIQVSNIDKKLTEQTLVMMFENERRHGGGEITTVDYKEGSGKAIISFKDPDVARRLINKGIVEHKNVKMSIKHYSGEKRDPNKSVDVRQSEEVCRRTEEPDSIEPSSSKGQAVEVSRISKDMSEQVLHMIFENKRYGGGPIERLVYEKNGTAVIWFQDSKVVQGLLAKEVVTYKDHQMFIKIHEEESKSRDYPSTGARNKEPARGFSSNEALQIRNIPSDFKYDQLGMLLSNKRYGGGAFDRLDYTPGGDGTAMVWFKDSQIIASLLRQEVIDFKGHTMFVSSHQLNSMPSNDESYQSYQQTSLPAQASLQGSLMSDTIKVNNIPTSASKDMVILYFENSRKSGGGDLELIQWKPEKGKAVFRYKDSKVAMNVVKRSHQLSNADLSVVLLEKPLDGIESYAVEVTGIPKESSEDLITLYFENSRRNGGGEIEEFIWDKNVGKAVITFKKSDVVTNLLKCPHQLNSQKVTVMALKPLPPPPLLLEDIDAKRLLAKHLPTSVTLEHLRRFMEPVSNSKLAGFTWGAKPSVALVDFCSEPDYFAIRRLVSCKPIQGQMISVQRISFTRSVQVLDIPVGATKEFLTMYFESARVIGNYRNVAVTNIDVFPGYAIVSFSDSKIINDISKKHTFLDTTVDVKPYFSFLGVSSSNPPAPLSCDLPCEISAVNFILHRRELTTKIEKSLGDKNCQIFWPSKEGQPIVLKFVPSTSSPRPSKDWVTNPKSQVQNVLDQLKLQKLDVLQDIWNDFQRKVQEYIKKSNLNNVDVTYDNDNCVISYIGLHNATAELLKTLKMIESDLLKNKQKVSEILQNLKPHIIMLIETSNLVEEIAQKFKDVQIEKKKTEISLSGPTDVVSNAKLHLYQKTNALCDDSKDVSPLQQKLLAKEDTKAYLTDLLLQKKIAASFAVKEKEIVVYAFNQNDLKQGYEFICSELVQTQIGLEESEKSSLGLPQWKTVLKSIMDDYKTVEISMGVDGKMLDVACTQNINDLVQGRLTGFISKYALLEKFIPMELGYVKVITKYLAEPFRRVKSVLKETGGKIEPVEDYENGGFFLSASKSEIDNICVELSKLAEQVKAHGHLIDRPGIPEYFYGRQGTTVLSGVEQRHNVFIQLDKSQVDEKVQKGKQPTFVEKCKLDLDRGIKILLIQGDITKFSVDAIVNAANKQLQHGGGVAGAIVEAGGFEIQEECRMHIKVEGDLLAGQIYVSGPGRLPCKAIIHAVGPMWKGGTNEEDKILSEAVRKSLDEASKRRYHSIAIPAISSAIFGYPVDMATSVIVETIYSYLEGDMSSTLKEVYLLDMDDAAVNCFERIMRDIGAGHSRSREHQTLGPMRRHASARSLNSPIEDDDDPSSASSWPPPSSRFTLIGKSDLKTAEGVTVHLYKGSIIQLKVDAIVNTTGKELDLKHGNVSNSILKTAGPEIQAECTANKPPGFDHGQIVVTKGYKLGCRYVYHGSCRSWDNHAGNCERTVRTFMKNIFKQGCKDNLSTVALPAIGTGNLKIPHDIVADIMYDEVEIFSKQNPRTLKDIHFVVYDKDQDSIKAFENKIKDLSSPSARSTGARSTGAPSTGAPPTGAPPTGNQSVPTRQPSSNQVPVSTLRPGSNEFTVGTIKVAVAQGDITRMRADAIINSTNEELDLSNGAVSRAILNQGGDQLKQELKRAKMGPNKVCVTKGGNLPAKNIIHLVAAHNATGWKTVIVNCLSEAERLNFGHIVLPLLGTGNIGSGAGAMAVTMVDSIAEFCSQRSPRNLNTITICIFQQQMVSEFLSAVSNRGKSSHLSNIASGALQWVSQTLFGSSASNQPTSDQFSETNNSPRIPEASPRENTGARPRTTSNRPAVQERPRAPVHDSRIVLDIYGLSEKSIKSAVENIEQIINEYIQDHVMESPKDKEAISKLDENQITRIKNLGKEYSVKVELEKSAYVNRIHIRGPPKNVTTVLEKINTIFHEVHQRERENAEAESISKQVKWEYKEVNGFEEYPPDINLLIEKAFQLRKPYAQWEENDAKYQVTFATMVEEFLNRTGEKTQVRRRAFNPEIPPNWEPMTNETVKLVALKPTDTEYQDVEKNVRASCQTSVNQIVKIERIQNPTLFKQYWTRKMSMENANPNIQNERTLWHGTQQDTLQSINDTGFNRSYCGRNAVAYGRGVYFAKNFSYSAQQTYSPPDANGIKYIYQSKVLVGEFALGSQAYIVPPQKAASASVTDKYDSVVDNVANPSIFVIFYDTQAYPEYLIQFN